VIVAAVSYAALVAELCTQHPELGEARVGVLVHESSVSLDGRFAASSVATDVADHARARCEALAARRRETAVIPEPTHGQ